MCERERGCVCLKCAYHRHFGHAPPPDSSLASEELAEELAELREDWSCAQLREAGWSPDVLRAGGFLLEELRDGGFTAAALQEVGFSLKALKRAGFSFAEPVEDESISALAQLDGRLLTVLSAGDIRLLRCEWIRSLPPSARMQRRQQLEALEASLPVGALSPLLSPAEAVALVKRAQRCVGVLSYGWLVPDCPDPANARLSVIQRALLQEKSADFGMAPTSSKMKRSVPVDIGLVQI